MKLIARNVAGALAFCGAAFVLGIAVPAEAQDVSAGAKGFATKCQACHQVDLAKGSGLGPNLAGIVGRKAGALPRFNYSSAMIRSNIVWDKARLDIFLAGPQRTVPGSRMSFAGLSNAKDRADIIAFLSTRK